MSEEQLVAELEKINELNGIATNDSHQMKQKLKEVERTRHLMIWLDNSTVANSGYLACLVTCLFDPAQIQYTDKMRFCHGDMPLRAFEAGQQKGGNYFCSSCGIHCDMVYCLDHALNCEFTSLEKRQKVVLQGPVARRNSCQKKAKPFYGLSKGELKQELASRQGKTKGDLKELLVESLQGKQRVPALLINNPEALLFDFGLDNYEILPCEPLHDIGHHIEECLH